MIGRTYREGTRMDIEDEDMPRVAFEMACYDFIQFVSYIVAADEDMPQVTRRWKNELMVSISELTDILGTQQ